MTYRRSICTGFGTALAVTVLITLNGCVGALLGGGKPDALYRFGAAPTVGTSGQVAIPRRTVALAMPQFSPENGGDRILTTQGNANSYIKDMRWVTAAPILYAAALRSTVATRAPDIAVAGRGGVGRADALLTVSVERFEASYATGSDAAPIINVAGHAVLFDSNTKVVIGRYQFSAAQPAGANTGAAIAAAFEIATAHSVVQLVDWTNVTMPLPKLPRLSPLSSGVR